MSTSVPIFITSLELIHVLRVMDLIMLTHCNALERELDDWNALITAADPRFKVKNVSLPPGSALSFIEIVFEE